jgi:uncharacterized membrane protein
VVHFNRNLVNDNTAIGYYGGCYFYDIEESEIDFIGNQFNRNTAGDDHGGLYFESVYDGSVMRFWDNQIIGNRAGITETVLVDNQVVDAPAQVLGGDYGGLYLGDIEYGSEVDFRRNQVLSNTAYLTGTTGGDYGGMYAYLYGAGLLTMVDNTIAGNKAQEDLGGLYVEVDEGSRLVMEHNLIQANTAVTDSAGVYIEGEDDSQYFLRRNQIVSNSAGGRSAGLYLYNDDATEPLWGVSENNLIADNGGVGIRVEDMDFWSTNDTVADNVDYGIWMTGTLTSTTYLSNTILWGHTTSFASAYPVTQTMKADYSDIEVVLGNWPGMANLNTDPLFQGGGDYHLQGTSPVINQADLAAAPARDLDNIPRPVGAGVDMGCYEYHLSGVTVVGDVLLTSDPGTWVTHTVTITNNGDAEDSFDLSLSGNAWSSNLSASSVILADGAATSVEVAVKVPPGASAGEGDTVDVDAVSTRNAMVVDSDSVDTEAALAPDVDVYPDNAAGANVGSTQIYHHTVENLGNGSDTFNLNATSSQGWTVQVVPSSVTLGEGLSITVEVRVTVPAGAAGQVDVTTLTATSAADGSVSDSAADTTTAVDNADLSLTPASQSASAGVNSGHTYTHTLTNNAGITDTVALTATSGSGWTVAVRPSSTSLNPGASATVYITVTTPASGADGDTDLTTLTATSGNDPSIQVSASDLTILDNPGNVTLTPNNAATALVGASHFYTHTLTNNGSTADTLTLSATSDQGWTVSVSPSSVALGAGASTQVAVTVTVPGSGANGLVDITMVQVASTNAGGDVAAAAADVTTLLNPASIVLGANQELTTTPDSAAIYTHTLTNDGASVDTISLAVVSSQGWTTQLSHDEVTLQPGASADIVLQVQVPVGAAEDTVDTATLTATSAYGAAAHATNTSTTTIVAGKNAIYLPLVVKNR